MEHIVGIKIYDQDVGELACMTWGRIFHPVDERKLLNIVHAHLPKFGIVHISETHLCNSLQEIKNHPPFTKRCSAEKRCAAFSIVISGQNV